MQKGIYQIRNKVNNQLYIGSTTRSFAERWGEHLKELGNNRHGNKKLQNSFNKYGIDNFLFETVEILNNANPKEIVNRERFWLNELRPYYNIMHVRDLDIHRLSKSHEKFRYHLVSPQGIHFCITNLTAFAKENNLADTHLMSAIKRRFSNCKGWRGSIIKADGSLLHPLNWEPKDKYHLISPEGIHQCVWNLTEFCRDKDMSQGNFRQVVMGAAECRSLKGWRGSVITSEGTTPYLYKEPEYQYHLVSSDGIEMCTSNLQDFCKGEKLNLVHMYAVCSGRRNHNKGWRVKRIEDGYIPPVKFNKDERREEVNSLLSQGHKRNKYMLTSPEGVLMSSDNLKSFAEVYSLTYTKLYEGAKTGKPHKGWRVNKYV